MDIDLQSQMNFGDEESLRDLFLVHRFVHDQYSAQIVAQGGLPTPTAGLSSEIALADWVVTMKGDSPGLMPALGDWLQLHQNLHQAEFQAVNTGFLPDLVDVDFSDQQQFYDWMELHRALHKQQDSVLTAAVKAATGGTTTGGGGTGTTSGIQWINAINATVQWINALSSTVIWK